MGALEDAREAAAQPVGARRGQLTNVSGVARLLSIDAGTARATVSFRGSQGFELPYLGADTDYTGITTVLVLCNPMAGGRAEFVLGPIGVVDEDTAGPAPVVPTGTVTEKATILPTWSGTWRVIRSAWDRWNIDRYGGRSDLYQGDDYGSGTLIGLATYGDQIKNLGATAITAAVVSARRNGSGGSTAQLVLQGAPHASQPAGAPSPTGTTAAASAAVAIDQWCQVTLPSDVRENLRTGAAKALAAVGGTYSGWGGTATAGSMVISLTLTRPA
ncbi:hypothetical protein OEB99_16490 [Actinotalea sp. M2MS4P-6]|uniref:hypothetical protein n=1 Tax=Actinotalea sp. M2MS4P-6 TaxID=2983762 RepID=UPI0021E4D256|nr:hypothetical protein [Actinotalea sp. M2MS4P-6]MCV2395915.1 hypothetical protein [Actinotalea sp. M2MS4P-6]